MKFLPMCFFVFCFVLFSAERRIVLTGVLKKKRFVSKELYHRDQKLTWIDRRKFVRIEHMCASSCLFAFVFVF